MSQSSMSALSQTIQQQGVEHHLEVDTTVIPAWYVSPSGEDWADMSDDDEEQVAKTEPNPTETVVERCKCKEIAQDALKKARQELWRRLASQVVHEGSPDTPNLRRKVAADGIEPADYYQLTQPADIIVGTRDSRLVSQASFCPEHSRRSYNETAPSTKAASTNHQDRRDGDKYYHHLNFHNGVVYHKTATPPAVSLWAVFSTRIRHRVHVPHAGFTRESIISSQAAKLLDPFQYNGETSIPLLQGTALRDAVTSLVERVYWSEGRWLYDSYGQEEDRPLNYHEATEIYQAGSVDECYHPTKPFFIDNDDEGRDRVLHVNDDKRVHLNSSLWDRTLHKPERSNLSEMQSVDNQDTDDSHATIINPPTLDIDEVLAALKESYDALKVGREQEGYTEIVGEDVSDSRRNTQTVDIARIFEATRADGTEPLPVISQTVEEIDTDTEYFYGGNSITPQTSQIEVGQIIEVPISDNEDYESDSTSPQTTSEEVEDIDTDTEDFYNHTPPTPCPPQEELEIEILNPEIRVLVESYVQSGIPEDYSWSDENQFIPNHENMTSTAVQEVDNLSCLGDLMSQWETRALSGLDATEVQKPTNSVEGVISLQAADLQNFDSLWEGAGHIQEAGMHDVDADGFVQRFFLNRLDKDMELDIPILDTNGPNGAAVDKGRAIDLSHAQTGTESEGDRRIKPPSSSLSPDTRWAAIWKDGLFKGTETVPKASPAKDIVVGDTAPRRFGITEGLLYGSIAAYVGYTALRYLRR